MKKTKVHKNRLYPIERNTPQTKDLPATQGMLHLARTEAKEGMKSLKFELKADIKQVDSKIDGVDAKIDRVLEKVDRVLVEVHGIAASVARMGMLNEEQNSRNRIVLESHTGLAQRQDRLEARVDNVEKLVRSITRTKA